MATKKVKLVAFIINELEETLERKAKYEEILDAVYRRSGEKESCSSTTISRARAYLEEVNVYPDINNTNVMAEVGRVAISHYLSRMEYGNKSAIAITSEAVKAELYRSLLEEMKVELLAAIESDNVETLHRSIKSVVDKITSAS